MVDNEIDEPEPNMIKFVTEDGIVETAVKERVDFLCDIDDHDDGQDYFKNMFPTSKDVLKEKNRDVFNGRRRGGGPRSIMPERCQ